jgi:hypothetical protein
MNQIEDAFDSLSYFWDCITLSNDCPFLSSADPKLYYFGFGLLLLYGAFLVVILTDLNFFWSVDNFQRHIDVYINLVRKKVRHVQMDQRRLVTTQERTEKLLKKSEDCKQMVNVVRRTLLDDDPQRLSMLTCNAEDNICQNADGEVWNEFGNAFEF